MVGACARRGPRARRSILGSALLVFPKPPVTASLPGERSLMGRVVGAATVVVVLLVLAFVLFLNANTEVREAELRAETSSEVVSVAIELQTRVVQLQNSLRGLVLTGEGAFLADYRSARSSVGVGVEALRRAEESEYEYESEAGRLRGEEAPELTAALVAIEAYRDRFAPIAARSARAGVSRSRQAQLTRKGRRRVSVAIARLGTFVDIREVAQLSLEAVGGYQVLTASSGREGLETARSELPDAILLDWMMPDMDGPTTFEHLRGEAGIRDIPVVMLTAKVQAAERRALADLGVSAVLSKPFEPMQLANQVRQALGWGP